VKILVAELDLGDRARRVGEGRIDAVTFEVHELAIAVAVLVYRVEAACHGRADRITEIHGYPFVVELAALHEHLVNRNAVGFLEHAIDDAASAAAPEDHGIGAFEHLNAGDVVKVANDLGVVAEAVDKQVRVRPLPANDEIIAVAFTLMRNDAGHVADRLAEALGVDILDEVLGEDGDRLRDVQELRVRLRRGRGRIDDVADRVGAGLAPEAGPGRREGRSRWRRRRRGRRQARTRWRADRRLGPSRLGPIGLHRDGGERGLLRGGRHRLSGRLLRRDRRSGRWLLRLRRLLRHRRLLRRCRRLRGQLGRRAET
jgi:hypothetical protein